MNVSISLRDLLRLSKLALSFDGNGIYPITYDPYNRKSQISLENVLILLELKFSQNKDGSLKIMYNGFNYTSRVSSNKSNIYVEYHSSDGNLFGNISKTFSVSDEDFRINFLSYVMNHPFHIYNTKYISSNKLHF